jgi:hypothetical protein
MTRAGLGELFQLPLKRDMQQSRSFIQSLGQQANVLTPLRRETVTELGRIKQMLFGGFARCLYPLQKFDSGTERRLAVILERDASKWFKPAKGQFQIYYKLGTERPEYIPDFVVETDANFFMAETKARNDIDGKICGQRPSLPCSGANMPPIMRKPPVVNLGGIY